MVCFGWSDAEHTHDDGSAAHPQSLQASSTTARGRELAPPMSPAGGLLPGVLVNARVKAVLSDGLQVSFLTYFTGTVDPFHLGQVRR